MKSREIAEVFAAAGREWNRCYGHRWRRILRLAKKHSSKDSAK